MFAYARGSGSYDATTGTSQNKEGNYRLLNKFNPYIGTFHHTFKCQYEDQGKKQSLNKLIGDSFIAAERYGNMNMYLGCNSNDIMVEARKNPLIGTFRHSPANSNKGFLTDIANLTANSSTNKATKASSNNNEETPMKTIQSIKCNQLQINRRSQYHYKHSRQLQMSLTIKSLASRSYSFASTSSHSSIDFNQGNAIDEEQKINGDPVCSICLESFIDGAEISALSCNHCFHSKCVKKWFLQSNNIKCPDCRQEHDNSSICSNKICENITHNPMNVVDNVDNSMRNGIGISELSFEKVGESLLNDLGYDFLSDIPSQDSKSVCGSTGSYEMVG